MKPVAFRIVFAVAWACSMRVAYVEGKYRYPLQGPATPMPVMPVISPTTGPTPSPVVPASTTAPADPTVAPMGQRPSVAPARAPTKDPTREPTRYPTQRPTVRQPTQEPTPAPVQTNCALPTDTPQRCSVDVLYRFDPCRTIETVATFVAMGDTPYSDAERYCLNHQLRTSVPANHDFLIHVGDIKSGADNMCDEGAYSEVASIFKHFANTHNYDPRDAFFVPGDNEWVDCEGGRVPATIYWDRWTRHFGKDSVHGFGSFSNGRPVQRQHYTTRQTGGDQRSRQENFAFQIDSVLFMGINLIGGNSYGDESERLLQNFDWIRLQLQSHPDTAAVVLFGHADLIGARWGYFGQLFVGLLETSYPEMPVMYMHGDKHAFCVEYPDVSRLPNLVTVALDDGGSAPPLIVSVVKDIDTGKHLFTIDQQGGEYSPSCPGIFERTW